MDSLPSLSAPRLCPESRIGFGLPKSFQLRLMSVLRFPLTLCKIWGYSLLSVLRACAPSRL